MKTTRKKNEAVQIRPHVSQSGVATTPQLRRNCVADMKKDEEEWQIETHLVYITKFISKS